MKWLFVEKGSKLKKIFFVACNEAGKPMYSYDDVNLAYVHEKNTETFDGYTISDFLDGTKKKVEASWRNENIEDHRPIIKIKDFGKILKEHNTEMKL